MYFNYKKNKIYYEKHGKSKEKLIILPGWGDNRKTFNNIINKFKNKYEIYILDYPSFGLSTTIKTNLTIYDYANLIIKLMKIENIEKPTILGHSFGGRIIITMSGYYNIEFKKIILIDSAGIKPKKTLLQKIKQLEYKFLKKLNIILPKKHRKKYLKKLISIFGSNDYKQLDVNMQKTFISIVNEDLTKYIKNINEETLIIWGEKDTYTPLNDAIIMNELIKNSGLVTIKNADHFCYLQYPEYINLILDKFI